MVGALVDHALQPRCGVCTSRALSPAVVQRPMRFAPALVNCRLRQTKCRSTYCSILTQQRFRATRLLAFRQLVCFEGFCSSSVGPMLGLALLSLVVVTWLPGLSNVYRQESRYGEPVREIAQIISATARPSDLVLIHSIPSGCLASRDMLKLRQLLAPGSDNSATVMCQNHCKPWLRAAAVFY